jgi:hypothetical protein
MTYRIELLPAENGDCLWIEYGRRGALRTVVIDGGTAAAGPTLIKRAEAALRRGRGELEIDLLVVTHIDNDHIAGMVEFFRWLPTSVTINDVWFNGWKHLSDQLGPVEGEILSGLIESRNIPWNNAFSGRAVAIPEDGPLPEVTLAGGMKVTVLGPMPQRLADLAPVWEEAVKEAGLVPGVPPEEPEPSDRLGRADVWPPKVRELAEKRPSYDKAPPNGSSITFLAEFKGDSCLFTGDCFSRDLTSSVERLCNERQMDVLEVSALKMSHHGSRHNTESKLLKKLKCGRYLISTNGKTNLHPDFETLARVIVHGGANPELIFNYDAEHILPWRDKKLRGAPMFTATIGKGENGGVTVELSS